MEPHEIVVQERYNTSDKANSFYKREVYDHITPKMVKFLGRQKMMFIATSDNKGECDSSLRTSKVPSLTLMSDGNLVYPEFSGNGVMASIANITVNPNIAILLIDFQEQIGLHINGKATVVELEDFPEVDKITLKALVANLDREVVTWVVVDTREAYIHCSRNIPTL